MKVFLTGATGFIGTPVVQALVERGDECVVISRGTRNRWPGKPVRMVNADPTTAGRWEREVDGCDVVVNLAGERIVHPPYRWTEERKRRLRRSRIETTRNIVAAIGAAKRSPRALISGSAIGFYGARDDETVDESTPPGTDFLAALCVDWEAAAQEAARFSSVTTIRSGLVLGKAGGIVAFLLPIFKLGVGGPWGDGKNWCSWIHLADEVGIIMRLISNPVPGPVNLSAPNPVTVDQFAAALARALNRPAGIRVPEFVMRVALGESADPLFKLQRVMPRRALEIGYRFQHEKVESALQDVMSG